MTTDDSLAALLDEEDKLFEPNRENGEESTALVVPSEEVVNKNRPAATIKGRASHLTKGKLEDIGNYMVDGLSVEEAATLAGVAHKELYEDRENFPVIDAILTRKVLEFKQKHLKIVGSKRDEKTSQWLLEKIFPKEFGSRPQNQVQVNILDNIIKEIQKRDSVPVKIYEQQPTNRLTEGGGQGENVFGIGKILGS